MNQDNLKTSENITAKRDYSPPQLLVYGNLSDLTQSAGAAVPDGGGGSQGGIVPPEYLP